MLHVPGLFITHSEGRGRGVFTAAELSPGDLIEFCPLILMPKKDKECIHASYLHDYYFLSPEQIICIALGYGSIYNHNIPANVQSQSQFQTVTCVKVSLNTSRFEIEIEFEVEFSKPIP